MEGGRVEEASAVDACRIGKERGEEPARRLSCGCVCKWAAEGSGLPEKGEARRVGQQRVASRCIQRVEGRESRIS